VQARCGDVAQLGADLNNVHALVTEPVQGAVGGCFGHAPAPGIGNGGDQDDGANGPAQVFGGLWRLFTNLVRVVLWVIHALA